MTININQVLINLGSQQLLDCLITYIFFCYQILIEILTVQSVSIYLTEIRINFLQISKTKIIIIHIILKYLFYIVFYSGKSFISLFNRFILSFKNEFQTLVKYFFQFLQLGCDGNQYTIVIKINSLTYKIKMFICLSIISLSSSSVFAPCICSGIMKTINILMTDDLYIIYGLYISYIRC